MRTCTGCFEEKELSEFYFYTNRQGKSVPQARCKVCRRTAQLEHQKTSPTYKDSHRRAVLKHRYGVTPEWYDETLAAQGGHCALCPATVPGGRGEFFSVDHDHETGRVRALLCHMCNTGLGWYENHRAAVDNYLSVS